MLGWFANAIMCGWDHHAQSTKTDTRQGGTSMAGSKGQFRDFEAARAYVRAEGLNSVAEYHAWHKEPVKGHTSTIEGTLRLIRRGANCVARNILRLWKGALSAGTGR